MSILDWFKSAALLSVVLFFTSGSYFFWTTAQNEKTIAAKASGTISAIDASITHVNSATTQIGSAFTSAAKSVSQTEKDIHQDTAQIAKVAAGVNTTVSLVNAPCIPGPCGLLGNANKTLGTFRLTAGQLEVAANTFDKNESHFYAQEDQLFTDSDGAVNHLNSLLTSPDVTGSIHNFNTISYNLGQSTGDFQTKFHDFLYPAPCKGFKCWVKNGYEAVKVGSDFAEPAYWAWALWRQAAP